MRDAILMTRAVYEMLHHLHNDIPQNPQKSAESAEMSVGHRQLTTKVRISHALKFLQYLSVDSPLYSIALQGSSIFACVPVYTQLNCDKNPLCLRIFKASFVEVRLTFYYSARSGGVV